MSKITASANGKRCQIRLPGVCTDSQNVVWCHAIGQAAGKGIGMKVPDLLGAYGCQQCHDVYDRRVFVKHLNRMEIELAFYEGVMRSQRILIDDGLVTDCMSDSLFPELHSLERGEFICKKCWIRKDAEKPEGLPEF